MKHLLDKPVIAISNENAPVIHGTLVRFEPINKTRVPVVKDENGKEWFCMGIILPDEPVIAKGLGSLNSVGYSPKETNAFLSRVLQFMGDVRAAME